ncbi:MFS transporter [Microbacterium pygmaeum]|uniref:Predicted arabinose efflux permease, MFS family n=1 Tax=Microbacterium pygmaeum TaxID=370764 RepID=A0A1G7XAX1_9MICO|nr:MFS transporter [Microbacterium pygmaeum]SDG81349.1 Predicted arabinose efflux permease, MFS family [Microbacterium pygmaeum]
MKARSPGGNGWLWTVSTHSFFVQGFTAAFRPALAYAFIAADVPIWMLGVLAASFSVPALALALPIGRFVDVFGERRAALIGALSVAAGALVALFGFSSPSLVLLASLLVGAGHMPSVIVGQVQVAHRTPRSRLDAIYGLYAFSSSCGQLIGPLLLIVVGGTRAVPDLELVFGGCVVLALGILGAAAFFTPSRPPSSRVSQGAPPGVLREAGRLIRHRGVVSALIVGSISVVAIDIVQVYWPALGVERGYDVVFVSIMLSLRAVMSMISRLIVGPVVARFGRLTVLMVSTILAGISLAVTALPLHEAFVLAAAVVLGFVLGVCQPLTMSWLAEITPAHNRGASVSLRLAANRVGQTLIPVCLGLVGGFAGAGGVVLIFAVMLCSSALLTRRPDER